MRGSILQVINDFRISKGEGQADPLGQVAHNPLDILQDASIESGDIPQLYWAAPDCHGLVINIPHHSGQSFFPIQGHSCSILVH